MGKRNGSLIGKRNVGAGATNNASGIWGLNDTQRVMSPDNSSALKSKIKIQYLLVGGGGGGAGSRSSYRRGGGGGAGGMVEGYLICDSGTELRIKVGAGGNGRSGNTPGASGTPSKISTPISASEAFGGGGGRGYDSYSSDGERLGGSGGGQHNGPSGYLECNSGYVNQGNPGGYPWIQYNPAQPEQITSASGGGGAGGKGQDAGSSSAGDGGIGKMSYITNTGTYYAGGGGGGAKDGHTRGSGGAGGGGNGGLAPAGSSPGSEGGSNGQANTGGGGGGAATGTNAVGNAPDYGGNGGTGVVILRFPQSVTFTETGTGPTPLTYSGPSPVPGTVDERYYTFTAGDNKVTFTST